MNLFKSLVFTDKGIDDLTTAAETGKTIEIKRGVLCGYNPPDDNQVYNPYRDASGVLDVDAVKSNINKYFAKSEALKATTTPTPYIEGIVKLKTVKKDNKNILSFALDFENTDFDHDVAVKFFGYESWAALIASEKELTSDCKCLALLAQDDAGLEYIFAFAKLASGQQLQYPLALTEELTHRLHVDLYISINQSDNIVIKYTPDGLVEYNELEQHVELANNTYAKKVDVYTKVESDNSFLTKSDAAATYTTKTENAKKANSSDVYTKIESDDKFLTQVEAAQEYATKEENAQKADKTSVYTKTETYNRTEIDDKAKGTIVINYDIDTKTPTQEVKQYNQKWLVDNAVLAGFADHINRLRGRNQLSNPDFNTVQTTGIYCITDLSDTDYTTKHAPVSNWGTLHVLSCGLDTTRLTQIYISDVNPAAGFYRSKMAGGTWTEWQQLALKTDINNLENTKANKSEVYTKTETYPKTQLYTQAEVNELLSAHLIRTTNDIEKYQLSSILDAKKGNYYFYKTELIPDWIKNYNLTYNNRCMVEIVVQGRIRSYDTNEVFVRFTTYLREDKAASYYGWGSSNEKMIWYDSQGNRVNSQ